MIRFNRQLWDETFAPLLILAVIVISIFIGGWAIKDYVVPAISKAICEKVVCR
jgi:hypothetical protein